MTESTRRKTRRRLLLAGGAGVAGVAAWMAGRGGRRPVGRTARRVEAEALAARIRLPADVKELMASYARDPEKVRRFRELSRWRRTRRQDATHVS